MSAIARLPRNLLAAGLGNREPSNRPLHSVVVVAVGALAADTVIDLSDLAFASPLDLVGLASLITAAPVETTIRLIPPTSEPVANYLLRMDLPAVLNGRVVGHKNSPMMTEQLELPDPRRAH